MVTRTRYRSHVAHITVDLDDFDEDTIVDYLKDNGYYVAKEAHCGPSDEALVISEDDIGRISTLALCGQRDSAREHALKIISDHIGRKL